MRTINFRGKSYTDNAWHYGYFYYRFGTPFSAERYEITEGSGLGWNCPPESIGQYTGLKDYNGRSIYEGDLVKRKVGGKPDDTYLVFYSEDASFSGVPVNKYLERMEGESLSLLYADMSVVVVGNAYDAKEANHDL